MQNRDKYFLIVFLAIVVIFVIAFFAPISVGNISYQNGEKLEEKESNEKVLGEEKKVELPPLDKEAYDAKLLSLANNPPVKIPEPKYDDKTGELIPPPAPKPTLWPKKTVYPNPGAILPFNRIVAYYGNLYSKKMGVLGEYPKDEMLAKLDSEAYKWEIADPETPVLKALHYIAVVAQADAGRDGKYRLRMPDSEIQKVLKMADEIPLNKIGEKAIVFLDVQTGYSDLASELPLLEKYLKLPNVHLGLDPEFSMKGKAPPGKIVGTMDGETDINFAINFLDKIVKENNLPPKVLVVHRYTRNMLTNSQKIKPTENVQVVIHMDGWGGKQHKISTHKLYIYPEPVQFTGFKIFYKNDIKTKGTTIFEPSELLKLNPRPIYIQYQ